MQFIVYHHFIHRKCQHIPAGEIIIIPIRHPFQSIRGILTVNFTNRFTHHLFGQGKRRQTARIRSIDKLFFTARIHDIIRIFSKGCPLDTFHIRQTIHDFPVIQGIQIGGQHSPLTSPKTYFTVPGFTFLHPRRNIHQRHHSAKYKCQSKNTENHTGDMMPT